VVAASGDRVGAAKDMATIAKARSMRKAMSLPEARMWAALKSLRAKGFHFRRQHPLHGYFLDFVCLSRGLAVEVDGASHEGRGQWDRRRDAAMADLGLRTIRIAAVDVRDRLPDIMDFIVRELEAAAPTRPLRGPPPRDGEGE
jgi:very-short-patch-repair endonuclease